ncbi:MAG: DUF3793 family protein [Candidatus Methanoplasma sp.]|jgi:hypothetical protein|nr:DUF3793 family protein [Candidatus Methanoplasma sp.]
MMERKVVEHCSPTLAGIKCGSLFKYSDRMGASEEVRRLNGLLNPRGISVRIIYSCACRDLVLVYRENKIMERLSSPEISGLLHLMGYDCCDIHSCLTRLTEKMNSGGTIPPEIGIFLGYPLEDVLGFMEYGGRYSKTMGCWKVYGDEECAVRTFAKYKKCRDIFLKKYEAGSSITKLAVPV